MILSSAPANPPQLSGMAIGSEKMRQNRLLLPVLLLPCVAVLPTRGQDAFARDDAELDARLAELDALKKEREEYDGALGTVEE